MSLAERTRQQLDPAGSTGVAPVANFLAIGALLYAVVMSLRGAGEISQPFLASAALVLLVGACAIVIVGASSARAPLTNRVHLAVHAVALLAIVFEALGQWRSDAYVRNDWGPVALGILIVALAPYRPAREIAAATVVSAIGIGVVTAFEVPAMVTPGPPLAFIVAAVAPMLALGLSAAAFSRGIVASIERWQRGVQADTSTLARQLGESIARSVREDRVTILNRDVVPFFTEVLARDTVTAADRARARQIADSIRKLMVEQVDRTWLETLVESTALDRTNRPGAAVDVVDDPRHLASAMTLSQRTAIRALIDAFMDIPTVSRDNVSIVIFPFDGVNHAVITAQIPLTDGATRARFAPFFAVMRAVFASLEVEFVRSELTLRFSYAHQ